MIEKEIKDMSLFIESMWEIVEACDNKDSRALRAIIKKTGIWDSTAETFNDLLDSIEDWFISHSKITNGNQFFTFREELYLFWEDELWTYCKSIWTWNIMYSKNIGEFNEICNLYD